MSLKKYLLSIMPNPPITTAKGYTLYSGTDQNTKLECGVLTHPTKLLTELQVVSIDSTKQYLTNEQIKIITKYNVDGKEWIEAINFVKTITELSHSKTPEGDKAFQLLCKLADKARK